MSKKKRDSIIATKPIVAWIVTSDNDSAVTFAQTSSRAKGNMFRSAQSVDIMLNWNGLRVRRAKQYDGLVNQVTPGTCQSIEYTDRMLEEEKT